MPIAMKVDTEADAPGLGVRAPLEGRGCYDDKHGNFEVRI